MTPHHREILAYVAAIGGDDGRIDYGGRKGAHPRVRFTFAGSAYAVTVGSSPSDRNAIWLARRYIRRTIGLERLPCAGRRRVGREHCARPLRLAQSAAPLPDWRDALRRHPVYLAFLAAGALECANA